MAEVAAGILCSFNTWVKHYFNTYSILFRSDTSEKLKTVSIYNIWPRTLPSSAICDKLILKWIITQTGPCKLERWLWNCLNLLSCSKMRSKHGKTCWKPFLQHDPPLHCLIINKQYSQRCNNNKMWLYPLL